MKFELFRTSAKQWRWRLRAANGKIIANSGESYRRKCDCLTGLFRVRGVDWNTPIVGKDGKPLKTA